MSSIPESGRSPGGRHGNPLRYSCMENSMDRGAWWATAHRITKSQTGLKWLSKQAHKAVLRSNVTVYIKVKLTHPTSFLIFFIFCCVFFFLFACFAVLLCMQDLPNRKLRVLTTGSPVKPLLCAFLTYESSYFLLLESGKVGINKWIHNWKLLLTFQNSELCYLFQEVVLNHLHSPCLSLI